MNDWKDVEEELPSCDGSYEVISSPSNPFDLRVCYYNGYGFIEGNVFKNPQYWRVITPREKRYGKITPQYQRHSNGEWDKLEPVIKDD